MRPDREFFRRSPEIIAHELIGFHILHQVDGDWVGGLIVETEAYRSQDDPASHSRSGVTPRCQSMFCDGGTLYVYSIHAKYCLNLVTQCEGVGSAVLIRAIEPTTGVDSMQIRRGHVDPFRLTRGPAMLCQAMNVTKLDDGIDGLESPKWRLFRSDRPQPDVGCGPRIGISQGRELPLRFFERNNPFVSGPKRLHL